MPTYIIALVLISIAMAYFFLARRFHRNTPTRFYHSRPHYSGFFAALISVIPSAFILISLSVLDDLIFRSLALDFVPTEVSEDKNYKSIIAIAQIENVVAGLNFGDQPKWVAEAAAAWAKWIGISQLIKTVFSISVALVAGFYALTKIGPAFRSRNAVETIILGFMAASSAIAIFTTVGIIFSVVFESLRFFALVPVGEFLLGLTWNPQFEGAERAGSGQMGLATYGSVPLFVGTFLISAIALMVSVPVGLFSAIYLAEYASQKSRSIIKPALEILAGIPTVVYGFFAALVVAPFVRSVGLNIGLDVASESALAAGLVMGIMIIPFVSSLSDDVINAVPQSLRDAAYGLGSTKSETICKIVLPAALPGVAASILLAVSRAVGETMIVVMAAGLAANLSINPLEAVTTVTSQIVTILVGDQEFESAKTLSAFALALTLIIITLGLNFISLQIVKKYREQYD